MVCGSAIHRGRARRYMDGLGQARERRRHPSLRLRRYRWLPILPGSGACARLQRVLGQRQRRPGRGWQNQARDVGVDYGNRLAGERGEIGRRRAVTGQRTRLLEERCVPGVPGGTYVLVRAAGL